jgi:small nuclear ribonucleoprotein G
VPLPDLNKYLEKRILVQLNGSRKVMGILRGYDVHTRPFPSGYNIVMTVQVYLNLVLDEALEEKAGGDKVRIGMVVIRGNAVVMLEVQFYGPTLCLEDLLT